MVSIAPFVGFVAASITAVLVNADATRRALSRRTRLRWSLSVGLVSFGGFLLPIVVGDGLARVYLDTVKSAPVVTSPREFLVLHLVVGLSISATAVLSYGFGSRLDRLGSG